MSMYEEFRKIEMMTDMGEEMAQYLTDSKEEADFQNWCTEELGLEPEDVFSLDERHMGHIFCKAKWFQHLAGLDIAPYNFTSKVLEICTACPEPHDHETGPYCPECIAKGEDR